MSRYDADDVYCIPGTAVLKNKVGITDQDQLDEYEGDFTAIRLLELTQNPVDPDGHPNSPTCGHLKLPHPERGVTMG